MEDLGIERGISQDMNSGDNLNNRGLDTSFLGNEIRERIEIASTRVVLGITIDTLGEPLEGGETLDVIAGTKLAMSIRVDLGDQDLVVLAGESLSELLVDLNIPN